MERQNKKSKQNGVKRENAKQKQPAQEPIQKLSFTKTVEKAMNECAEEHVHNHPLYQPTSVHKSIIDEKRGIAAWVLFEQIDTDRCTPDGEGFLGDQYRYSVWLMKDGGKPTQLFEDHSYIRRSISGLTNKRGRDPQIDLIELVEGGIIIGVAPPNADGTSYTKMKKMLTFSGKLTEAKCNIMEEAENAILAIAPRLGYDYMSDRKQVESRNDAAAFVWGCENGSTYGYSVLYFAVKRNGKVQVQTLTDTRSTKDYIHIKSAKFVKGKAVIESSVGAYEVELD